EALGIKTIEKTLKNLLEGEAILIMEDLKERYKPKPETYVKLSEAVADEEGLEAAFKAVQSAARQEEALMMYVQLSNRYGDFIQEVKKTGPQNRANVTCSVVKDLVKKG